MVQQRNGGMKNAWPHCYHGLQTHMRAQACNVRNKGWRGFGLWQIKRSQRENKQFWLAELSPTKSNTTHQSTARRNKPHQRKTSQHHNILYIFHQVAFIESRRNTLCPHSSGFLSILLTAYYTEMTCTVQWSNEQATKELLIFDSWNGV